MMAETDLDKFNPDWSQLEQCRENLREQWKVNTELVDLVKEARSALIVLSDDCRKALDLDTRPDSDTVYAWTIGTYRRMWEVAERIDATLAAHEVQP